MAKSLLLSHMNKISILRHSFSSGSDRFGLGQANAYSFNNKFDVVISCWLEWPPRITTKLMIFSKAMPNRSIVHVEFKTKFFCYIVRTFLIVLAAIIRKYSELRICVIYLSCMNIIWSTVFSAHLSFTSPISSIKVNFNRSIK